MKNFWLVLLVGFILTVIITWPFVPSIATFFTDYGDYPYLASTVWYNYHALITGQIFHQASYFNGFQAYPHPYTLAYGTNLLIPALIFGPIYLITQNYSLSINSLAVLTFVLTFISSYYCSNYFLKNRFASLIAAAIFTFNPLTLARFPEHLDLLNKYFLPPIFLFGYLFFRRPGIKNSLFLGLFFTLNALSVNYYLFFSLILLPICWLPFATSNLLSRNWRYFLDICRFSLVCLIFLPILSYFLWPYLDFSRLEGASRSLDENNFFAARLIDWVAPNKENRLYGSWVASLSESRAPKDDQGDFNYLEHSLAPGVTATALFLLGLLYIIKHPKAVKIQASWFYGGLLVTSFVLTFGPYFMGWNNDEGTVPLPFLFLYHAVPIFQGIRVPTRFEFVFLLPFALSAGFGSIYLFKRYPKVTGLIGVALLIFISLETATTVDVSARSDNLRSLAEIATPKLSVLKDKPTIHFPIYTPESAIEFGKGSGYLTWATQTQEKIVNLNAGYLPPDQLMLLFKLKSFDQTTLMRLKALNIEYLIVHKTVQGQSNQDQFRQINQLLAPQIEIDTPSVAIYNLNKLAPPVSLCRFEDLSINSGQALDKSTNTPFWAVVLTNPSNCYLPSFYNQRYHRITTKFGTKLHSAAIRLPVLIEPNSQTVLSEYTKDLKIIDE